MSDDYGDIINRMMRDLAKDDASPTGASQATGRPQTVYLTMTREQMLDVRWMADHREQPKSL